MSDTDFDGELERNEELKGIAVQLHLASGESNEVSVPIFGRRLVTQVVDRAPGISSKDADPAASPDRFGAVVFNQNGQVLLVEPTDHFDGYVWTFPKTASAGGESREQTAVRAVIEKTGITPSIVANMTAEVGATTGGTSNSFYIMLGSRMAGDHKTSEFVKRSAWVTPHQAAVLLAKSKNSQGRERDLAILKSAICEITFRLSVDSVPSGEVPEYYEDPHWMDWFRLERPWGMEDGSPATRAKLDAFNRMANQGLSVELTKLGHPLRPLDLPPPSRIWSRQDMATLRQGMVDDRGLCMVEGRRLFLYRSMSGRCMFEANFVTSPFGWVIDKLVVDESIYLNGPGTGTWESLTFEHIIANLLLKKLDEALWRRFFGADRRVQLVDY